MISIYCMIFLFHCVINEIYRVTKKKVGHDINIMGHCTFWALPFFFPLVVSSGIVSHKNEGMHESLLLIPFSFNVM